MLVCWNFKNQDTTPKKSSDQIYCKPMGLDFMIFCHEIHTVKYFNAYLQTSGTHFVCVTQYGLLACQNKLLKIKTPLKQISGRYLFFIHCLGSLLRNRPKPRCCSKVKSPWWLLEMQARDRVVSAGFPEWFAGVLIIMTIYLQTWNQVRSCGCCFSWCLDTKYIKGCILLGNITLANCSSFGGTSLILMHPSFCKNVEMCRKFRNLPLFLNIFSYLSLILKFWSWQIYMKYMYAKILMHNFVT